MRSALLLSLSAWTLVAQIGFPGQYPPGQYPPGQNPGRYPGSTGTGAPIPGRGSRKSTTDKAAAPEPRTFSGVIRKLDAKSLDLELSDTRFLIIQILSSTTKPDLKTGDGVDVVATEDKDAFQAVSIKPNPEIARTIHANDQIETEFQERTGPPPTILVRPNAATDADDSGPPKLKRGKPPARASAQETQEDTNAASPPPPEPR